MYRVLRPGNFPTLERPCRECNSPTVSTGQLFFNPDEPPNSRHAWCIVFTCPLCQLCPVWAPELVSVIRQYTTGVDGNALPIFGASKGP